MVFSRISRRECIMRSEVKCNDVEQYNKALDSFSNTIYRYNCSGRCIGGR